jgi:hypothetical protein
MLSLSYSLPSITFEDQIDNFKQLVTPQNPATLNSLRPPIKSQEQLTRF